MTISGVDEFRDSFFEECEDLLGAMHDGFGLMQEDAGDDETIHVVFRAVHSIKGGAGAFGLDDLVRFAHHFETALDRLRSGAVSPDRDLLTLFQRCGDHLADLVVSARDGSDPEASDADALHAHLDEVVGETKASPTEGQSAAEAFVPMALDLGGMIPAEVPPQSRVMSFEAEPELFLSGNEPAFLFSALERLGSTDVSANLDNVPPLAELDPAMCHIAWRIEIETDASDDVLRDVFEFVSDCATVSFVSPEPADNVFLDQGELPASIPEPVVEAEVANHPEASAEVSPANPDTQEAFETPRQPAPQTIRVDFERVDKLINLVGELVIKEAMLSQAIAAIQVPSGCDALVELDGLKQLASKLQEGVMAIRAQPVKPLFQRMGRTIRDAAAMTGKQVRIVMKGETAEIDKTVLERLVDPLTHMVRNAVDHGLESPDIREAAGKSSVGTITLSAAHRSGRVVIEIADDGAGVNRDRVRAIAEEKGLIAADAALSPEEIDALLFLPGFSSKDEVSELSGRGVGLDVANSEIVALGGRLAIQSTPGEGSIFSISLPLTLAVLEGMVVSVAGHTMVVPITAIQETLIPDIGHIHTIGSGARVLKIRDSLVPIADLGEYFGFRPTPSGGENQVFLVLETESGQRCALLVDSLQGQRQVVIKSLEANYQSIVGIAAATILGDGRIALIVDPDGVVKNVPISDPTPNGSAQGTRSDPT